MSHRVLGFKSLSLAGLLFLLGSGSALSAGVLYSQPWEGDANAVNSQNDTSGGNGNFATSYDNFVLTSGGTVTKADWLGLYCCDPSSPNKITGFTIAMYADAAGQPGSLLQAWSVIGNAGETPAGSAYGFEVYQYSAGVYFVAAAGTEYWLSVQADLGWPPAWGWSYGTGGDGSSYTDLYGTRYLQPGDLAFTLESAPEPFTFPIAGIGLAALTVWRRRR